MRALVWNNPYGALMLHGKVETRTRGTNVTGEVLICTAKKPYGVWTVDEISGEVQARRIVEILGGINSGFYSLQCQKERAGNLHGYAIGVGNLVASYPMSKDDEDRTFVKYDPNRWCWEFENVKRIEPFQWNFGKQGWAFVPDSELLKIKYV